MHRTLEQLNEELAAVLSGLDAGQAQLRPHASSEKWCVQQIVEHLMMSYRSTSAVLRTRIEKGSATKTKPTIPQRLAQFTVLSVGYLPSGRKSPEAVTPAMPASSEDGEELMRRARGSLSEMDAQIEEAEHLFGAGRCATHFALGPLSPAQWRRFHLVHGRHHIKQILRIRNDHQI